MSEAAVGGKLSQNELEKFTHFCHLLKNIQLGKCKCGCSSCCLCTLIHTKFPKDKKPSRLTRWGTGPSWWWSVPRLWALWRAATASSPDSAILSHLPLTTGNKVFLMLTNGVTAWCPQTRGRTLPLHPHSGWINEPQGGFNNNFSSFYDA